MSPHSNSEAPAVFDSAPVPSLTSTTTTRAFEESDTRIGSLPCLVLMLVTFALFAKSIPFEFINFDDGPYVYGNTHVRSGLTWEGFTWAFTSLNGGVSYWHPITW